MTNLTNTHPVCVTRIQCTKKHSGQFSVKQAAYNHKNRDAPGAALSQTIRLWLQAQRSNSAALSQTISVNYKSQDRLTIPVCQTIHLHTVSNNPQYAAGWNGTQLCGVGLVGTDISRSGVSRRTGSVWTDWASSAWRGYRTWRQHDKEQGIRKIIIPSKGQIT